MSRRATPADPWQYGDRSADEVRGTLLELVLEFVIDVRAIGGVERIALLGSLTTVKARPKDADLLVSIATRVDLDNLARLARRLKGRAQGLNSGADIFLATEDGHYLGRICHYRDCQPRARCHARHCGAQPHLNDDLDVLTLPENVVQAPPIILHPVISARVDVPPDVESRLLSPLRGPRHEGLRTGP